MMPDWARLKGPTPDTVRVFIRMTCGASYTITCSDPNDVDDIVAQFTDERPGFTTVPGHLTDNGQRRMINRAHITSVSVDAFPNP